MALPSPRLILVSCFLLGAGCADAPTPEAPAAVPASAAVTQASVDTVPAAAIPAASPELSALVEAHVSEALQEGVYHLPPGGGIAPAGVLLEVTGMTEGPDGSPVVRARFADHRSDERYEVDFAVQQGADGEAAIGLRRLHKIKNHTL